ncbi:hypothetical protein [Terrabacter sp. BE26]|uniref:hypothetical protein n=1 Tax=Terrabacter sp. BE26 TaxID=2898152 RepID=UPI0035BE9543
MRPRTVRFAAATTAIGVALVTVVVTVLHPGGGDTTAATFASFAASNDWTVVHLLQFFGMALLLGGLLALFRVLAGNRERLHWLGFFGAVAAAVALVLSAVVFATDGVANKFAVDTWVSAAPAAKPSRFAAAEALRWLEIGTTSYQELMLGISLALLGILIVVTRRLARTIGYVLGLSGLAFVVAGWMIGLDGFTPTDSMPTQLAYIALLVAMIWLVATASRIRQTESTRVRGSEPGEPTAVPTQRTAAQDAAEKQGLA